MYCPSCGTQTSIVNQAFCQKCGAPIDGRYAVSSAALGTGAPAVSAEPPYAEFWPRAAGYIIDSLLSTVAIVVLMGMVVSVSLSAAPLLGLLYLPAYWLYFAIMESSSLQATVGKLAVGVKVTDAAGERIGFGRATGRHFARLLSGMILGIGYLMAAFTGRRQALHDMIAGTYVVRRRFSPQEVAAAGPAPAASGWAVALGVIAFILIGPFGIGILAAIAIPAYQDYTIRAQVMAGLSATTPYKEAIAAAVNDGRGLRELGPDTLRPPRIAPQPYVDSIEIQQGAIVITYGGTANRNIAGARLLLVPGTNPSSHDLTWVCGHHEPPQGLTMAIEDADRYTTLKDKYLPITCRAGAG